MSNKKTEKTPQDIIIYKTVDDKVKNSLVRQRWLNMAQPKSVG